MTINTIVSIIKGCKSKKKNLKISVTKVESFSGKKELGSPNTFNTLGLQSQGSPRTDSNKFDYSHGEGNTQYGNPKNETSLAEGGKFTYFIKFKHL